MSAMLFVPLSADDLRGLARGGLTPVEAYAATPGLCAAYGLDPARDDEEADHVAQLLASLACVRRGQPRLVAAAGAPSLPPAVGDADGGGVRPAALAWTDVRALFVDDPDDPPAADALAAAEDGDLTRLEPMLWFAPTEVAAVLHLLARQTPDSPTAATPTADTPTLDDPAPEGA